MFPKQLKEICAFLSKQNIILSEQFDDGRINASINEDEIIKIIKTDFDIQIPKSRAWFDFAIENKTGFYPVNIKVTNTTHFDNLNCKLGVYYALTGLIPDFQNEINWLDYFIKLKENIGINKEKDYYFLVVNKQIPNDIFINSLKGIKTFQPNGNNLPFQCKWNFNKKYCKKTFDEAKDLILSNFGTSIKLRSEIYFNFKKYFPKYV